MRVLKFVPETGYALGRRVGALSLLRCGRWGRDSGAVWVEDCLFCRKAGPSGGVEHVISRSLGNNRSTGLVDAEMVLSATEVCADCNHGPLAAADEAMTLWAPLSIAKTLLRLPNKRGRLVNAVNDSAWDLKFGDGLFELSAEADLSSAKKNTAMARGLFKIAVEAACMEDRLDARTERWDELRRAALGERLPKGVAVHASFEHMHSPAPTIQADFYSPEGTPLRFVMRTSICGVALWLSVGGEDPANTATWATWTVGERGLLTGGPNSAHMRFSGQYNRARQLPDDTPEPLPGRAANLPTGTTRKRILVKPSEE